MGELFNWLSALVAACFTLQQALSTITEWGWVW